MKRYVTVIILVLLILGFGVYSRIKSQVKFLTTAEAKELIESYNESIKDTNGGSAKRELGEIIPIGVPDAWEKTKSQVFFTTKGGSYIIQNKKVIPVLIIGSACVADIDKDGRSELVQAAGFGSGIYRVNIAAYRGGKEIASSCWVPKGDIYALTIKKIDDNTVNLISGNPVPNGPGIVKDYGKLMIVKQGSKKVIVPEKIEDFPFKQWDITN